MAFSPRTDGPDGGDPGAATTTTRTSTARRSNGTGATIPGPQAGADCEPYEAGKSEITRRFTIDHTFNTAGDYRVEFRLKQKNKVVAKASTDVKIRPGIRDNSGDIR